jgi:hypothetical protein
LGEQVQSDDAEMQHGSIYGIQLIPDVTYQPYFEPTVSLLVYQL